MKKAKKFAFTMAEAILVMTILGIIATIMISTLKPAEFKEKGMQIMAKKVMSEIDVATTQILMNNTADGTLATLYEAGTSNIATGGLGELSAKFGTVYKGYLTTLRKAPEANLGGFNHFLLKDGAAISIGYIMLECTHGSVNETIFPGETQFTNNARGCGYIEFDINDNEPPNVYGKDRFRLPIGPEGIVYDD